MRRASLLVVPAILTVVLGAAACGGPSTAPDAAGSETDTGSPVLGQADPTDTADPIATADPTTADAGGGGGGGSGDVWPSPEDCISYDAQVLISRYEAGVHVILPDHGSELVRVFGGPGDPVGDQAYALAHRYDQVCFIGRGNTRADYEAYVFEYWRNPSPFIDTPIPGGEDCSSYDPTNLQVDDTGSGWRVRDDDHVLQLFDTEQDANNGKIVLAKYDRICAVHSETLSGVAADLTYA